MTVALARKPPAHLTMGNWLVRSTRFAAAIVTSIPDALMLTALWLCLVVSTTITLNLFTPWLVLPLPVVLTVLSWRWRPGRYLPRLGWLSTLAALVFVVGWLIVNIPFAAQWLDVSRDPGFYTLEGVWLSGHMSPNIPFGSATALHDSVHQVTQYLPSFIGSGSIQAQGSKLVPGLVAMGGWVGGVQGVLVANIVIGAVALLFFYGLCRRIVGPLWSLLALVALGISMPFVYFSRAVFTEPLLLAVTFAGLTFLVMAARRDRWQHFLLGGALIGAGGLARIDGAALIIGLAIGLAFLALGTLGAARLTKRRRGYLLAVGAGLLLTAAGGLETYIDSPLYMRDLAGSFLMLLAAAVVVSLVGLTATFHRPWRWLKKVMLRHPRPITIVFLVLTVAIIVGLLSRPLWYFGNNSGNCTALIAGLQRQAGLKADCWASYDQDSVNWLAMYLGWPLVIAAFLGVVAAVWRVMVRRDESILPLFGVVAAPSLFYLVYVNISADQIWAMRRFLPVTIPGFILLAIFFLRGLTLVIARSHTATKIFTHTLIGGLALALSAFPLFTWGNLFDIPEHRGVTRQMQALCTSIDHRPVVINNDSAAYKASDYAFSSAIRILCSVPVVRMNVTTSTAVLAKVKETWPTAVLVSFDSASVPWQDGAPAPTPTQSYWMTSWPQMLNQLPTTPISAPTRIWVNAINPDGSVALTQDG